MYTKAKLKEQLTALIEPDNAVHLEMVKRYINLVTYFYELDKAIKKEGVMVETVNASQTFLKANPALAEKTKINAQLIKLIQWFDKRAEMLAAKTGEEKEFNKDDFL